MIDKYLIVNKKILPDYFDKVLEVRNLLTDGKIKCVSEAVKLVGISRSTYYKYKDFIFLPSENTGRKAVIALMLEHRRGVLSEILNYLSEVEGNIITINQNLPINNIASVIISLDISHLKSPIEDVITYIEKMKSIVSSKIISIE